MKLGISKKLIKDVGLNIGAVVFSTAILQLIILPLAEKKMGEEQFGAMITVVAFIQLVAGSFANALNNVRLIRNNKEGKTGIYNLLTIIFSVVSCVMVVGYCIINSISLSFADIIALIVLSIVVLLADYYSVYYRLKLNYTMVLISSVLSSVGYFVGLLIFNFSGVWHFIYLMAYLASTILAAIYGKPHLEGLTAKAEDKEVVTSTGMLVLAKFLGRISTYADKIIMLPILGGAAVTVYYQASLLGKCLSMVISPLNNVILSHLCSSNKKKNQFWYTLIFGGACCFSFYIVATLLERPFLMILYPDAVDEAMKYIYLTNLAAVLMTLVSMLEPFVLKNCKLVVQLIINGGVSAVYCISTLTLGMIGGLMGFCVACVLSYIVKLIIVIVVYKSRRLNLEES